MAGKINPSTKLRVNGEHDQTIKLIIGLGNPGKEYLNTYHSVGFLFIDYFNENRRNFSPYGRSPEGRQFLKSDAYMNESGLFVAKTIKKIGLKPEAVLIVHDDSDIQTGNAKLSFGRSSAGHKGVQSIVNALKTKNFWRLRIGIRTKSETASQVRRLKAGAWVLKKISRNDQEILKRVFEDSMPKILGI